VAVVRRSVQRRFARDGFVVMPLVPADVCRDVIDRFEREVDPWDGLLVRQLTSQAEPHQRSVDGWMTNPIVNPRLLTGFPSFWDVERTVMQASMLVPVVSGLLGAPPVMLQSAYYCSSQGTKTHVDFNPVDRSRPMLGVWIALEDIGPEAGRFYLYPGSHVLPETPAYARFAELAWANYRQAFVDLDPDTAEVEAQALLAPILAEHALTPVHPPLRAGEAVFWDRRVLHGSDVPRPGGGTRHSLLFHFIEAALATEAGLDVTG
jgi:phytanoyl-CoA hydroxylase